MENDVKQEFLLGETVNDLNSQNENAAPLQPSEAADEGYFGKPERYDYSQVELPEKYSYNNEMLEEFNGLAAKYNLSQKSANELMGMAVKMARLAGENFNNEIERQKNQRILEYKNALINDKDIGGINFNKTLNAANAAYKCFADADVQALLQETGLNCHPKIVKMFYEIGKHISNDNFFGIASPAVKKENREDILFPTM